MAAATGGKLRQPAVLDQQVRRMLADPCSESMVTNFAAPLTNNRLFDAKGAPVSFAGQITSLTTTPRQLQLGLKLIW